MKKAIALLSMTVFSTLSLSNEYVAIINSEYTVGDVDEKPVEPIKEISGLIVHLLATSSEHLREEGDINNTSSSTWASYYGETKDIAITSVIPEYATTYESGNINWFNSSQRIYINNHSGCTNGDYANAHIQYLDKNNQVVFWTNVFEYGTYGSQMTYGKLEDMSDAIQSPLEAPYPVVRGILSFEENNNKVIFEKDADYTGPGVLGWELNDVDVSSIAKVKLNSSILKTEASNGCSSNYHMWLLKDGESYQDILN